jgi:hypothetical protein
MNKKIKKVAVPAAALVLVGAIGGITASQLAYLTDAETTTNVFTIGGEGVNVDLEEPHYPGNGSDEVTDIVPNSQIAKDPQVENTGDNKTVNFLRVLSPMALIDTVNDDGTQDGAGLAPQEIFWMKSDSTAKTPADQTGINIHETNFSKDWIELTSKEVSKVEQGQPAKYLQAKDQTDGTIKYEEISAADAETAMWNAKFFRAVRQEDGKLMMESVSAKAIENLPAAEKVYTITKAKYTDEKSANPSFVYANEAALEGKFVEVPKTGDNSVEQRMKDARIFKDYIFGYNKEMNPKDKSDAIFDKVQLKNFIEGEVGTKTQDIVLEAYAIQSEYILSSVEGVDKNEDGTLKTDVFTGANGTKNLETVYDTFIGQGTAGRGDEAQSDLYKNVQAQDANAGLSKDLNGNANDISKKRLEISVPDAKIQVDELITPEFVASINGVAQSGQTITWSTANPAIAVIDNGQVKGVAVGTTELIGKWGDDANAPEARIEITVVNKETP